MLWVKGHFDKKNSLQRISEYICLILKEATSKHE